jgi:uncharacterized membrane protein
LLESLWPDVAVEPRPTSAGAQLYVRSYVSMRFGVGVLGVALPPLLVFVEPLLFYGQPFPRGSLSAYYYSGMREFFVGVLWAIGVFLILYKAADFSRESRLSSYAGLAVIFVALFPTGRPGAAVPFTPLQDLAGEATVERIHFGAAGIFIALLAPITYYFGREEGRRPAAPGRRSRRFWRTFHWTCTGLILAALALAAFAGITSEPDKGLLIAEWIAVWAFGASWLMKGAELDILLGRR